MPGTTSPLKDSVVAALVVDVDGTKLTTTSSEGVPITRVTVTLEVDRPGSFVIESADLDSSDFEWIDGGSVSEGKPVTISMGWGNDLGVVMIGDRSYDVRGAAEHGIPTIGAAYGMGGEEELREAGARWFIGGLDELPALLDRLDDDR